MFGHATLSSSVTSNVGYGFYKNKKQPATLHFCLHSDGIIIF